MNSNHYKKTNKAIEIEKAEAQKRLKQYKEDADETRKEKAAEVEKRKAAEGLTLMLWQALDETNRLLDEAKIKQQSYDKLERHAAE